GVLVGAQELAVFAVERVVVAVAREVGYDLALLTIDVDVIEHFRARRVEIPMLVRGLLEVPGDLAGVGVERDGRGRVEIVARPELRIKAREGIAGPVEEEIGGRVVGRRLPHAAAAHAPGIVIILPGLRAGLARGRNREGAPRELAVVHVPGADPASGAELAAGALALQDQFP